MVDKIKLALAVLVLAAGLGGFYLFSEQSLLLRVIGLLAVAGVAVAIAYQTELGRGIWRFGAESYREVQKVVWPTRKEASQTTLVVVAMVILVAFILWVFDWFLAFGVEFLTGRGG
jgi:preprotein translocase subunit SecE